MTTYVKAVPDGFQTVNVYLLVEDAAKQIAFVREAFGAKEIHISKGGDGAIIHADVWIGMSKVMIGQAKPEWPARPAMVYLYVEDVDSAFKAAVEAGARSMGEPKDQFYGDRSGGVEDPCGTVWWIATHVEDVTPEESDRRFAAMGHQH